jgi:peptide/nickel transport system ATP-binding protein
MQSAMNALNPVTSIRAQFEDALIAHGRRSKTENDARCAEVMRLVGIDPVHLGSYPHQLSGGMRQRAMIAMALACSPELLIADEPTTALDVTIQAQILDLLAEMKSKFGMAIMLITHAMGVVAEVAQRVAVMYAGRVVEEATVEALFAHPLHPYTQGLIRSIPRLDKSSGRKARLAAIGGTVPSLFHPPPGCRFAPRCGFATTACTEAVPELRTIESGHKVACILY